MRSDLAAHDSVHLHIGGGIFVLGVGWMEVGTVGLLLDQAVEL